MNFMYSNQNQLSQLQQQKPQISVSQQQSVEKQQADLTGQQVRNALSQSLTMLTGPTDKTSSLSPLAPSSLSQAGQILNLGAAAGNAAAFGGQILNIPNGNPGNGQNFYVMIPQSTSQLDSTQHQKIAPMVLQGSTSDTLTQQRSEREEKRRQTHNEVERRRRGKINGWIRKLAEMVPNCKDELGVKQQRGHPAATRDTNGQGVKSNCGVLQKTVNFIQELQIAHSQVVERLQEQNQVLVEMAKVRENLKRVEQENQLFRSQLQTHGIEPIEYSSMKQQNTI